MGNTINDICRSLPHVYQFRHPCVKRAITLRNRVMRLFLIRADDPNFSREQIIYRGKLLLWISTHYMQQCA